jgi:hypothetical protein
VCSNCTVRGLLIIIDTRSVSNQVVSLCLSSSRALHQTQIYRINVRLFSQWTIKMGSVVTAYVAFDVAADVYISAAVCWLLYSHKTAYRGSVNHRLWSCIIPHSRTGLGA